MKLSFWSSILTDYNVHKHTSVQLEISFSLREILYSRLFKQCLVVFYKNKQFSLKILKRLGAVSNMYVCEIIYLKKICLEFSN